MSDHRKKIVFIDKITLPIIILIFFYQLKSYDIYFRYYKKTFYNILIEKVVKILKIKQADFNIIPSKICVDSWNLHNTFIDSYEMEKKFESLGVYNSKKVITYCGGGISATTNMFALLLLGLENVSLYDGSLTEWGPDINLPMEVSEY